MITFRHRGRKHDILDALFVTGVSYLPASAAAPAEAQPSTP